MIVFLNGKFVPEEQAVVSIFDRGLLYGDGLFEAIRIRAGKPFRWEQHLERLQQGATLLNLKVPFTSDELRKVAQELSAKNQMPEAILRLYVSRGVGERGYSPKGANNPFLSMALFPTPPLDFNNPPRRKVVVAKITVPANHPLTAIKSTNKLTHILARAEADAFGADEALLVNTDGDLAEGTSCNLFWIQNNVIFTPPIESGALPGVTRNLVLELCPKLSIPIKEAAAKPDVLFTADGVFLSHTTMGIVEVEQVDGKTAARSPIVQQIQQAYRECLG
ncbi:MAG: branched-chain amino acid aminotransferase [Verrucomicrobiales bacterium]|nr:branched-chain amino acid aminotransferase [Verrucomicrobiales bacterium]